MVWDYQSSFLDYKDGELHDMLKQHGLPRSGTKQDKAARMQVFVQAHPYLTKPWNLKSSYHDYRRAELSLRLKKRDLLDSGTKAEMAERMQAFDDGHPFPFLKLPSELRNKIYKIAATQYYYDKIDYRDDRYINPQKSHGAIWQPGLIRCNKQLRNEGRPFFFQLHQFTFDITHHKAAFLAWFDAIGEAARKEIRHLTFEVTIRMIDYRRTDRLHPFCWSDVPMMDSINASVSDKAVVTWRTQQGFWSSMFMVENTYRESDPKKVPVHHGAEEPDLLKCSSLTFDLGK